LKYCKSFSENALHDAPKTPEVALPLWKRPEGVGFGADLAAHRMTRLKARHTAEV
jgi:hypothetical protein